MSATKTQKQSKGQIVALVVVAVLMAVGYYLLDRYTAGQKDMLTVETRGLNMVQALTKFRQESGALPDTLDKLTPKFVPAVSKCPNGQPLAYQVSGNDYTLTCQGVVFKMKPYSYDSKTQGWIG